MPETKEWTLMFYMASDNPLAISIVSQLKALKAAGFHHDANVIAQFDPFTEGTPTHIFDVNMMNKLMHPYRSNIGFAGTDSFVRNLIEDRLWRDEKRVDGESLIRDSLQELINKRHKLDCTLPRAPELNGATNTPGKRRHEPDPYTSLRTFLDFCVRKYPARRYMLFMLGHGVVVGNDVFMFDEHAEKKSITLSEMGEALTEFTEKIKDQGGTFELVSFHSCSVSSLEVAFELKDTAKYMLASQAPAFVGSWPYRQILIRIFNDLERNGNSKSIKELCLDIFYYCFYNSADYLLAGYSHQITLCDLGRVAALEEPMERLSAALVDALKKGNEGDAASKYVVLYAHWKSQSFFEEMYTDLYDFCHCIIDRCERIEDSNTALKPLSQKLEKIRDACIEVLTILKPDVKSANSNGQGSNEPGVIVASEFVGPAFQYSHGLSVYFPWCRPSEDSEIVEQYQTYKFHQELTRDSKDEGPKYSWLDFLEAYFDETQRETKKTELQQQHRRHISLGNKGGRVEEKFRKEIESQSGKELTSEEQQKQDFAALQEEIASLIYNGEGPLGGYALKDSPSDRTGDDCNCQSFKNFPRDTRASGERRRKAQRMPVSDTLLGDF